MPMVSQEVDELELSKPIKPRVYRALELCVAGVDCLRLDSWPTSCVLSM